MADQGTRDYSVVEGVELDSVLTSDQIDQILTALEPHGAAISVDQGSLVLQISVEGVAPMRTLDEGRSVIENALRAAGVMFRDVLELEVRRADSLAFELDRPEPSLVGVSELAEMLGVSRQRASELQTRKGFPSPLANLASGPVWSETSLRRFIQGWKRKPGRPRKEQVAS
jgi:hypothetical protein